MSKKAKEFLPALRLVPRDWHLSEEAQRQIDEIVDRAQAARGTPVDGSPSLDRILFPNQIETMVQHYLSRKEFGQPLPELRAKVRKLSGALEKLLQIMPVNSHDEIARQLRSLFCFDDPNPDDTGFFHNAREAEWDANFAPGVVRQKLAAWRDQLKLLDESIPKQRTRDPARDALVSGLAAAWRSLGLKPGNSRATGPQGGFFADMVRVVGAELGTELGDLEKSIRRVFEGKTTLEEVAE